MRSAALFTAIGLALAACKGSGPVDKGAGVSPEGAIALQGAGATFPFPLYSRWIAEYQQLRPEVRINYQSIGSGGGIRQLLEGVVDFGASDAPMTDAELAKARTPIVHVPTTLGAVVVAFNLPGVKELRLTPELVAGIFLGDVKSWNDPAIAAANPGVALPAQPIEVVHRTDGSGTTAVFTEYLAAVSPAWKEKVGAGKSVKFPSGLGAKGNEGVAGQLRTTPGSVGYVELAYAKQVGLSAALVRNRAGRFVAPSLDGITAAAAGAAASMPDDLRLSIVDAQGEAAYPISAFTYILVPREIPDARKGAALVGFLSWATHEGQQFGAPLEYAPLPGPVVEKVEQKLGSIQSAGRPLLPQRTL